MADLKFLTAPCHSNFRRIEKALREKPRTAAEVAETVHMCVRHVNRYLHHLKETRQIHIDSWDRCRFGRILIARYRWGHGVDAPRPVPQRALRRALKSDFTPAGRVPHELEWALFGTRH
jgi:hypothetical protein